MYSYEIDQILKSQNYSIDSKTYLNICNTSPQIIRVKYESFGDYFDMYTNDNCYWNFKVVLRGEL